jgi:hypothetical protein
VIILAVLVLVVLAAIVVIAMIRYQAPTVAPAVQPAASPQPTPATPAAPSAVAAWLAAAPIVRRGELVPVTVKRTTLMRLPSQELGVYKMVSVAGRMGWRCCLGALLRDCRAFLTDPAESGPRGSLECDRDRRKLDLFHPGRIQPPGLD